MPKGLLIVAATPGDFNAKRRDRAIVYEIYKKLTAASSSLSVTVAFSFDSEKLSELDKNKMTTESKGLIHFLPRRHFECYLVDPTAIANFIGRQDKEPDSPITSDIVTQRLKELAAQKPFLIDTWTGDISDEHWLSTVDAANLIKACCASLTNERVIFTKTTHSLSLLKDITQQNRASLDGLTGYVKSLFPI